MSKSTAFFRNRQSAGARSTKAHLLPMPRSDADELSLRVYIALDAMRRGRGCSSAALALYQVSIFTAFLARARYGEVDANELKRAETDISMAYDRGRETGVWTVDDETYALFANIVTVFDRQLRRAPLAVVAEASDSFERLRVHEPRKNADRH